MTPEIQEAFALTFVLLVAGTALIRHWLARRRAGYGCTGCAFSDPTCSSCGDRPAAAPASTAHASAARGLPILSG